jgi:hypothetical protein
MVTQDFNWNNKNTKSRFWDSEIGNSVIKEFSPKEIISNPNYHQIEAVVSSLCKVVNELVIIEEERTNRMMSLYNSKSEPVEPVTQQMELFPQENTNGNE